MKPPVKIHSLPAEHITPFQKRALTLLTGDSGLSAERILDILLMEALLGHFMGRGMKISGAPDISAARDYDVIHPQGPEISDRA
ncbi:hypothetical protein HF670_16545 [Acidithiobacillus thiooxidans]|uniref:Uncharacterized protein n=2 Tax=Acidithiobacillus thiooxidans TaxID=930 RepID=A0A1C2IEG1_ACITH|nr:hypothetical protein [Acidithiobacillus thiooxidans]MBU2841105.1 hypothetical protein [Acidithiobacillus thiooxidans]MBU2842099.1 hypothetical protein [Acidithiobacillus thiooxidans]OCX73837.1 hypothetical protein A6P07_07340 [Acidithiobacillus thiooxidans]OCX74371.1 hypothetical protein A6O24_10625 [Acidithiobacillus thiooxidans]OCX82813.1 hypothetical protein A6O26_08700 [Acidithiobacillus thiooxidans]